MDKFVLLRMLIKTILDTNKSLAKQALRVLMMAYKYSDALPTLETEIVEANLVFSGLVGMIDPERPEAAQAVKVAKEAGIRPIMITGDHQDTAKAIAKRLGIIEEDGVDHVFTGAELNELSDEEFQKSLNNTPCMPVYLLSIKFVSLRLGKMKAKLLP